MIAYSLLLCVALLSCQKSDTSGDGGELTDYAVRQARSAKRGVGFNTVYKPDFAAMQSGVSWAYNWGASGFNTTLTGAAAEAKIAYFPMVWNGGGNWASQIRAYKRANPECEYMLAFNEPNLTDQANMTPAQAAEKWPEVKELAQELSLKIVAPAMNYGTLPDYSDPIKWLDEFFEQPGVSLSDVSALSLHCYMNTPSAVKSFVERFRKYGKPVWMTEFCAWEGDNITAEKQMAYMSDVVGYFEADPLIGRYAWFKYDGSDTKHPQYALRRSGNNKGELTDLGKVYVYMSSLDKALRYEEKEVIPAEHYSNSCMSEAVGTSRWIAGVQLNVSSDTTGILEISKMGMPKWVEYSISVADGGSYSLDVRYATNADAKCKILCDGQELSELELPKTGGYAKWETLSTPPMALSSGQHTVRFVPSKGMVSLNWWRFKK
ncbi:MAG: DUF5010 C-terminal domain-containing protein [Prevotellaceae bacterium]|nr:DUF5010 C-terminal domain-containing protein [Prevotellaceae bacterium]